MSNRKVRVGIDVGGTHTKAVALDNETNQIVGESIVKTTHDDEKGVATGVIQCFQNCLTENNIDPDDVVFIAHSTTQATNVTVNGGTITGSRAIWIQLPGSNTQQAPEVNVTIKGGKLISTLDPSSDNYVALYSYSYGQSFANTNVTINGGEFTGHVIFGGGAKADIENVTINGGTFNGKLGRYLDNDGWEDIAKPSANP